MAHFTSVIKITLRGILIAKRIYLIMSKIFLTELSDFEAKLSLTLSQTKFGILLKGKLIKLSGQLKISPSYREVE